MSEITPVARKNELVVQDLGNELLIYDLKANKALSLNETSALVWQFSMGDKTVSQIAEAVTKKLNISVTEEFVWLALEKLKKENLIENKTEIPSDYLGASRREIIKKIGFASLVTLPVISSIVAPTALHAQSGGSCSAQPFPVGCPCVLDANVCATMCCGITTSDPNLRTCVPFGGDSPGNFCRFNCECSSTCCGFGPITRICVDCGSVAPGQPCNITRECASGNCGILTPGGSAVCI